MKRKYLEIFWRIENQKFNGKTFSATKEILPD
jgi:hypothetical protein